MTSLHDYESHLDELDRAFSLRGSQVQVGFSRPFVIDLRACASLEQIYRQTRQLVARLVDEPGLNRQYLVQRLIRLASDYHGLGLDAEAVANSIGLVEIQDVVRAPTTTPSEALTMLRFENGTGEYAGVHFVELERSHDHRLRVTRNMPGYGQHRQSALLSRLDVIETDASLLLFLPEGLTWQFEHPTTDDRSYWLHGIRIALHHAFSPAACQTIRSDLQRLMEGIAFSYTGPEPAG